MDLLTEVTNWLMRKIVYFGMFIFCFCGNVFAQSKNVQIEYLTAKADSLQKVIEQHEAYFSSQRNVFLHLQDSLLTLSNQQHAILNARQTEILGLKSELALQKKNNSNLEAQLTTKQHELDLSELQINRLQQRTDSLYTAISKLHESSSGMVTCQERSFYDAEINEEFEVLKKTCFFKNYKLVSTSLPDNAGRYSTQTVFYIKEGEGYRELDNEAFLHSLQMQ